MPIRVSSPAFDNMSPMPARFTCDGDDISPPLLWQGTPPGAKSIALIVDDPDAPMGTWVHWVAYDIPATVSSLAEDVPRRDILRVGGKQGMNSWSKLGYGGPCPPSGTHHYVFKLYVLDTMLDLPAGKSKQDVENAMHGHVLEHGQLVGTYRRR